MAFRSPLCYTLPYHFKTILSSPNIPSVLSSPLLSTTLQYLFCLPPKMKLHFSSQTLLQVENPYCKGWIFNYCTWITEYIHCFYMHSLVSGVNSMGFFVRRSEGSTGDLRGLAVPCKDFARKTLEDYQYLMICPGSFLLSTVALSQKMQCSKWYFQSNSLAQDEGTSPQTQKILWAIRHTQCSIR